MVGRTSSFFLLLDIFLLRGHRSEVERRTFVARLFALFGVPWPRSRSAYFLFAFLFSQSQSNCIFNPGDAEVERDHRIPFPLSLFLFADLVFPSSPES